MIIRNWTDEQVINVADTMKAQLLEKLNRDGKIDDETAHYYAKHYHLVMLPDDIYIRIAKLFNWKKDVVKFQLIKIEE